MRRLCLYSKAAVFFACTVGVAFHLYQFIQETLENPVGTTVESLQPPEIEKLVFCFEQAYTRGNPETFPLGFYLGAPLPSYQGIPRAEARAMYDSWLDKAVNQTEFLSAIQPMFGHVRQMDWEASENRKLRVMVEPLHVDPATVCSVNDQPAALTGQYVPSWFSLESNGVRFTWIQPDVDGLSSDEVLLSISLYNTEHGFQYLGATDFIHVRLNSSNYMKHKVALAARLKKNSYLNRNSQPCVEVQPGYLHPSGYLQRKCRMMCSLEAHKAARNCTPFQIYGQGDNPEDICHGYFDKRKQSDKESHRKVYKATFEDCQAMRQCSKRRYCQEWDIRLEETMPPDSVKPQKQDQASDYPYKHITVQILVNSKLESNKEYCIYTWETVLGNVGGIIGIFLGLSVFGLWNIVTMTCRQIDDKKYPT